MRVLCFDLDADAGPVGTQWPTLVDAARRERPDLVVLPEMPFAPWLAADSRLDAAAWRDAVTAHEHWLARFDELGAKVVITTRPVTEGGHRYNEAVVWDADEGILARRRKTYLPDEPGFYEASWYDRGPVEFPLVATDVGPLGVMVCTELWFPEHARALGQAGAQLVAVPRATPVTSVQRWEAGARVLATVAGAYCLSVNRGGGRGEATFAGGSVIVDPEGEVLARSTPRSPVMIADLDLAVADAARATYPRYVDASAH